MMKQKSHFLLFALVGLVMVGVLVLWFFSLRETLSSIRQGSIVSSPPAIQQQLRESIDGLKKNFSLLHDAVRTIPNMGTLPPDALATMKQQLQAEEHIPINKTP